MSDNSGSTGIPRMKARKMSKKIPFSGQKIEGRQINNLQWNVEGLSSPKMTEIKKTGNEENDDFLSSTKLKSQKKTINSITWMATPTMPCIKANKLQVAF
jgi:hypothetical protein